MLKKVYTVDFVLREVEVDYGKTRISGWHEAQKLFRHFIGNKPQEHFGVIFTDTKNGVLHYAEITKGIANAALVHPREVFRPAIALNAVGIFIGHNHPSGDPLPSNEDNAVTQRLKTAGEYIGIQVMDHIIIGSEGNYYSYKQDYKL
jgi:DNA repair protein RadC